MHDNNIHSLFFTAHKCQLYTPDLEYVFSEAVISQFHYLIVCH